MSKKIGILGSYLAMGAIMAAQEGFISPEVSMEKELRKVVNRKKTKTGDI